ncbi:hypothetical protein PRK78_000829 [Emydomyces testavorans]|uniref:Uncharacterized protein n=1 Tax=Emydomyces testavorans TaxID=2070801 RepID=A0AAF0DBW7_9EURO|nr:hypothetical protein PRK78_000829 [Emydomyces testavorans]
MASFFSPKLRSKARSSPALGENIGHIGNVKGDHLGGFDCKSTFSKMRKRRPPPINISVENGNVILTSATPTSRVIYADSQWPSTPQTPHTIGCTNPRCVERDSGLLSLLQPQFGGSTPWLPVTSASNPRTPPQQCFPLAELPASVHTPMSAELDAPSTPRRFSFDHDGNFSESPPNLISSSTSLPGLNNSGGLPLDHSQSSESTRNDRLISGMKFQELIEVLPTLSTNQIKSSWCQAMRKEALKLKRDGSDKPSPETLCRSSSSGDTTNYTPEHFDRMKAEYEAQLERQKNEICALLELHDSRMSDLCDFIAERHSTDINDCNEHSLKRIFRIVKEQRQRVLNASQDEKSKEAESLQNQRLQARVADLESREAHQRRKLKAYQTEFRLLKQELHEYGKADRRQQQEIQEKDAQINILNYKVTQLLTMGPSLFPASSVAHRIEKDLPSPAPWNWSAGELTPRSTDSSRARSSNTTAKSGKSKESQSSNAAGSQDSGRHKGKQRRSTVA